MLMYHQIELIPYLDRFLLEWLFHEAVDYRLAALPFDIHSKVKPCQPFFSHIDVFTHLHLYFIQAAKQVINYLLQSETQRQKTG